MREPVLAGVKINKKQNSFAFVFGSSSLLLLLLVANINYGEATGENDKRIARIKPLGPEARVYLLHYGSSFFM